MITDHKEKGMVCIYTGPSVNGVHGMESLVVEINGERIPYIHKITFGPNGVLSHDHFVTATIELAVRLGKP